MRKRVEALEKECDSLRGRLNYYDQQRQRSHDAGAYHLAVRTDSRTEVDDLGRLMYAAVVLVNLREVWRSRVLVDDHEAACRIARRHADRVIDDLFRGNQ
jgi:hypothetical protein